MMQDKKNPIENAVNLLLKNNLTWLEEGILVSACRSRAFWEQHCRGLVNKAVSGMYYRDFTRAIDNTLYDLADGYHALVESRVHEPKERPELSLEVLLNMLMSELQAGNISPDDFRVGSAAVHELWSFDLATFSPFCSIVVPLWLNRKRTQQLAASTMSQKGADAETLLGHLQRVQERTAGMSRRKMMTFAELMDRGGIETDEHQNRVFPINSLPIVNRSMGGGLIQNLCGLVICPSNGGKTVIANQFGSDLARQGFNVLIVSTEHTVEEMFVRQLSCNCDIDFVRLANGYRSKDFSAAENSKIRSFVERVGPHIRIEDLTTNPLSLGNDVAALIRRLKDEEDFCTQVLIVDWLGSKLGESMESAQLSLYLTNTLDQVRDQCRQESVAGLVMAQAKPDAVVNVSRVNSSHAAWCKTLHIHADWAFGVSLLEKQDQELNTSNSQGPQDIFRAEQFFNFFKTRNAPTGHIKVRRDFKYQRFVTPAEHGGGTLNTGAARSGAGIT